MKKFKSILQFLSLTILIVACEENDLRNTTTQSWTVSVLNEYYYSEQAYASREFTNENSLFIISDVKTFDTTTYATRFFFKRFELSKDNKLLSPENQIFENTQLPQLIDSLNLIEIEDSLSLIDGKSIPYKNESIFFRENFILDVDNNHSFVGEITGEENRSRLIISDQFKNKLKIIKLLDGPNYLIRKIDINKDGLNEFVIYNCLMNSDLRIIIISFSPN